LRRISAATAVAATILIACTSNGLGQPSPLSPGATPSITSIDVTITKAANLRTRLDLLLGEHVLLVAKESAAAAEEVDAYPGYVSLLAANASDLGGEMGAAFGNTAAAQFGHDWQQMNTDLVEYGVGLVTHNQGQADASASDLSQSYLPSMSSLIAALTRLPADQITRLMTDQIHGARLVVDDAAGQNLSKLYADLHTAYTQAPQLGDLLTGQIARLFPDKFPGDLTLRAVAQRAALNQLMQEHAYLATMATAAAIAGRDVERATAVSSLDSNEVSLGLLFTDLFGATTGKQLGSLWAAQDTATLDYAAGADAAQQTLTQGFVSGFAAAAHIAPAALSDETSAVITVINDQRNKFFSTLAADDRAAAIELQPVADEMIAAVSAQS